MKQFNKDEKSLLMFFEAYIVDTLGKVPGASMNSEDIEIAKRWKEEGLIDFGRIPMHDIIQRPEKSALTHWVKFSDEAWKLAHKFRRERGERHVETINAKTKEIKNNT